MKHTAIIHNFLLSSLLLLLISTSAFAAPIIRNITAANAGDLNLGVILMRQDLGGGASNGAGNSYTSGYREINWDDLPGSGTGPNELYEYYNTISPRGIILNPVQKILSPYPALAYSTNNFQTYHTDFQTYSGNTIFAPVAFNHLDISFRIPGTDIPASVSGFGVVFSDVDFTGTTWICLYDEAGRLVETLIPQPVHNGLTLLGATFNDGTRISRVSMRFGSTSFPALGEGSGNGIDKVAIDNIFYGEPRAIEHHSSDFDGDGGADYAVYRPSEGNWYVMYSGTNTYKAVHFGLQGDIPIDGDFDGDARNDFTVFRPSDRTWYILRSSGNQVQIVQFGLSDDKPVAGDYDKDGVTDIAVWRPSDGNYYSLNSSNGQIKIAHFGANGDIPIGSSRVP